METEPDGGQTSQASFSWAPLCSTRLSKSGPDSIWAGKDEDHTRSTLYISLHLFTSLYISLHLFTSRNENRHAKCPKDANSEFGQSDTPQAKQNRTGSIFQVGRHWTKEIQRIYQDWELPLLFLECNAELETCKSWKTWWSAAALLDIVVGDLPVLCSDYISCGFFLVVRLPQLGEVFRGLCRSSNSRPRASGNTLFGHGYISHSNGWEVWFSHDGYRALSESIPKLPESENLYTEMSEMLM